MIVTLEIPEELAIRLGPDAARMSREVGALRRKLSTLPRAIAHLHRVFITAKPSLYFPSLQQHGQN